MQPRFSYLFAAIAGVLICLTAIGGQLLASPTGAAFPGYNGKIAFLSQDTGGIMDIYTMDPDGTDAVNITQTPGHNEGNPSWSPDGTKIAFDGYPDIADIFIISPDGTGLTNLTAASDIDGYDPAWSPDGSKIVYQCHPPPGWPEICVMNSDGSGQTILTNTAFLNKAPVWSPDGTKIAFQRTQDGAQDIFLTGIYLMDPDGSNLVNLTNTPVPNAQPAWSPDGSMIAFVSGNIGDAQIYSINRDGTGITSLTSAQSAVYWPEWSPDGAFIIFTSSVNPGDSDLMLMRADGTEQTTLCRADGIQSAPSWQPLGSSLTPNAGSACQLGLPTYAPSPPPQPSASPTADGVPTPAARELPNTGEGAATTEHLPLAIVAIGVALVAAGVATRLALRRPSD
jgi:Tol biopolymer transport system component